MLEQNPLSDLSFNIDTTISHFGVMRTGTQMAMFSTPTGLRQGVFSMEPKFQLMEGDKMSVDSVMVIVNATIKNLENYNAEVTLLDQTISKKNGMDFMSRHYVYRIGKINFEGKMLFAAFMHNKRTLIFIGSTYTQEQDTYNQIWLKTLDSVKYKD